tara:strand:+ start:833 stop:1471 length:639 start_codon:yes stop_codon:yes gene_type:complete
MQKVIIVANADYMSSQDGVFGKKPLGEEVDKFDIVIRMNRYVTDGHEQHIGSKTDLWCLNRKILLQKENLYYGYYDKNWEKYKLQSPSLKKCVMMTYCYEKDEADELRKEDIVVKNNIEVADTYEVINELKYRWRDFYGSDNFKKPATGIMAILHYLNSYGKIYTHNFDWGKTSHYWGVVNEADVPSKHHSWDFEQSVVNDLINEGKVEILK